MLELLINIEGETEHDLLMALEEAKRQIEKGFTSGFDQNDTGSYEFNIKQGAFNYG